MGKEGQFLTMPVAVVIGSVIIAAAILLSSGTIKIQAPGSSKTTDVVANTTATPAPQAQPQPVTVTLTQIKDAFSKSQIKFGDTNKKLTIIEISDPSCPYCQIAAGQNPELNKQAGSRFTLVADGGTYVAPLPEIEKLVKNGQASFAYIYSPGHGNGEMGAKALYYASEQGKFWEVHNLLMSSKGYDLLNNTIKNDKTKSGDLADFLKSVIDPATLKQALDSGKYDTRLKEDMSLAQSLGVSGTPGFFLNTTTFSGAYNYTDMQATVNSSLQ